MKPKQHHAAGLPRGAHKQLSVRKGMHGLSELYKSRFPWENGHQVKIRHSLYLHYTFTFPGAINFRNIKEDSNLAYLILV